MQILLPVFTAKKRRQLGSSTCLCSRSTCITPHMYNQCWFRSLQLASIASGIVASDSTSAIFLRFFISPRKILHVVIKMLLHNPGAAFHHNIRRSDNVRLWCFTKALGFQSWTLFQSYWEIGYDARCVCGNVWKCRYLSVYVWTRIY